MVLGDPGQQAFDAFGADVSISATTVAIGAAGDDDGGADGGAVYVYVEQAGAWTLQQKIIPQDAEADDAIGTSLVVDGEALLIGAPGDDDRGTDAGAVYVFTRGGGTSWSLQIKILASDGRAGDRFGSSIGFFEDTLIVGAPGDDDGAPDAGSAYVFLRSGPPCGCTTTWTEQAELLPHDADVGYLFGASVDVTDDAAIVGAPQAKSAAITTGTGQVQERFGGAAYVFDRQGAMWTQTDKLVADDSGWLPPDLSWPGPFVDVAAFGRSVSIAGDTAVVGCPHWTFDTSGLSWQEGRVYVYDRFQAVHWTQREEWNNRSNTMTAFVDSPIGERFGADVHLDGSRMAVGAPGAGLLLSTNPMATDESGVLFVLDKDNRPPVASDINLETREDVALALAFDGRDPDGDSLAFEVLSGPANGTITGTAPNFIYTPAANFTGLDSFAYRSKDGSLDSAPATATVEVLPVNDPPTAYEQRVTGQESTPLDIVLSGSDVDGDPLVYSIVSGPLHGGLTGVLPNLQYEPMAGFVGADEFSFQVSDGLLDSNVAVIVVEVGAVNHRPSGSSNVVETDEDTAVSFELAGLDSDGDELTYTVVDRPTQGVLSGGPVSFTYAPDPDFFGDDEMLFSVSDGELDSSVAVVTLRVLPVNDTPYFVEPTPEGTVTVTDGTELVFEVVAEDVDDAFILYGVDGLPEGAMFSSGSGAFRWVPDYRSESPTVVTLSASDNERVVEREITVVVDVRDSDGDGIPDAREERWGFDPASADSDGDGVSDAEEFGEASSPRDTDKDGVPDGVDEDSDGDGLSDALEAVSAAGAWLDLDEDGQPNFLDDDSDGDGILDDSDNCYEIPNPLQVDADEDGLGGLCDMDRDGDGAANDTDRCPDEPGRSDSCPKFGGAGCQTNRSVPWPGDAWCFVLVLFGVRTRRRAS
jgi:hypothetical protein